MDTGSVLTELLCSESPIHDMDDVTSVSFVRSYFDPAVLYHPQALEQLKFLEGQNRQPRDYFQPNSKEEILPHMRKVVSMWMLEVCEEQSCEDTVFPLSAAILDQFLGCTKIKAQQLQLVACVCLLLASKTRQECHFSLQLLSWYTENSVSLHTLMTWEMMVLSQLNWDVNLVTPTDFVDFLLARTQSPSSPTHKDTQLVRRHAITFIAMSCTEPRFATMRPSVIAAAAIYTAWNGIGLEDGTGGLRLATIAQITVGELFVTAKAIEQVISSELAGAGIERGPGSVPITPTTQLPPATSASTGKSYNGSCSSGGHFTTSTSLTPTDVQDIFC